MRDQSSIYLSTLVAGIIPASYAAPSLRFNRVASFLLKQLILVMIWTVIAIRPAGATSFNLTFDGSTVGAPAGFFTAFTDAVQFYQTTFVDPITINLVVGWGQIDGSPLRPGNIGQSLTNQTNVPYSSLLSALLHDAESPDDATAVASLPASSPTATNFVMSRAAGKSLGLLSGKATGIDGWVGFNSNVLYSFDPNNRAVFGQYDFFGVASHEISEVMGRYGFGQNGSGEADSPIDLYRYSFPGNRELSPTFSGSNYFSIDGGATVINTFNTGCCGDLSDWSGQTLDAYNAFLTSGQVLPTSAGDLRVMDVLGYDIATGTTLSAVPEPGTLVLLSTGLAGLFVFKFLFKSAADKTRSF